MVKNIFILLLLITCNVAISQEYNIRTFKSEQNISMYSPTYYNNSLILCSNKKDKITSTIIDESLKEPINLFITDTNNIDKMIRFSKDLKSNLNDGPISFNGKYNKAILSKNISTEQKLKKLKHTANHLGLFEITFDSIGNVLSEVALPFNNELFNCTHPSLSENGNTLFFSSNIPGGSGGYDIWKSEKTNNKWGTPINLGPVINTKFDEVFPSISQNNILYFSANKDKYGGLDIYECNINNFDKKLILLDKPLNSEFDDFGIICKDNFENGYISSNRNGIDQILAFTYNYPEFNNCDSLKKTYFCYNFFEETAVNFENLESLMYQWRINGDTINGASIDYCFPSVGEYEIYLDVIDTIVNQTFYNQSYIYLNIEYEVQPYITSVDTITVDAYFDLSASKSYLPNIDIESYYWFMSDGTKYRGKNITHKFKSTGNHEVKLGIIDKSGNKYCVYKLIYCDSNYTSNENSFQSIKDVGKNGNVVINKATTYYEPLLDTANNLIIYRLEALREREKIDTSSDEYQKLILHDDFMIKFDESEKMFIYLIGKWNNIHDAHQEWENLVKEGNNELILRSFTEEEFLVNNIFVLKSIQFDINSWAILKSSHSELDKLVEAMVSQPNFKIIISAFTDNTGSSVHNLFLSEKRATEVKLYLINKGINTDNIKTIGMGSEKPIGDNSTQEGRQLNRRVEVQFVKK